MKPVEVLHSGRKKLIPAFFPHILCIFVVMAVAILVRVPSSAFMGENEKAKEAYRSENGIPYLTDMDSYYHVRLVNNYLKYGSLGNTRTKEGAPWDSQSYYPEGRSAKYQPGIVWLTSGINRLTGINPDILEYKLSAYMAALSALAAYLIGWRIKGKLSGFTAGLLIACAPVYAVRTCFGRFDTDMFVILLDLLLILFLTEALRASSMKKRILFSFFFLISAALYSLCWTASGTVLFTGITLLGGILYVLFLGFGGRRKERIRCGRALLRHEAITVIACGALIVPILLLTAGFNFFSDISSILDSVSDVTSGSAVGGVLPNLLGTISELNRAKFLPGNFFQAFLGYVAGAQPTVINGTGGAAAALLSLLGLARLFSAGLLHSDGWTKTASAQVFTLGFFILGTWTAGGLILTAYGVRFIEHLSVPVALLAGFAVGSIDFSFARKEKTPDQNRPEKIQYLLKKNVIPCLVCAAAVIPAAVGTVQSVLAARPSVTDASFYAMRYIRDNAKDPEAVIASWWDLGYYYESESDHPALWDGATQNAKRGILVSKALTSMNPELSRRILLMLSSSGNAALERLLSCMNPKNAFETLWETLLLEQEAAVEMLEQRCGFSSEEAHEVEALVHPAHPKETYLVLTYSMSQQIAWYEYFANWDFTGKQSKPNATIYSYTPEGIPIFDTQAGQKYLDTTRGNGLFWQLFFNARSTSRFTPAFEWHDGLEHVRVWLVEP